MPNHAELVICEQSIDCTFSWVGRNRRMSKDYEWLPESSEAFIHVAMKPPYGEEVGPLMRVIRPFQETV